ncbi:hypothetical protein HY486_03105 [Candidatus Woesearchaeota archaeon]|nr:hypothetical protein [Candidatus Woesearchaeota archaeon]
MKLSEIADQNNIVVSALEHRLNSISQERQQELNRIAQESANREAERKSMLKELFSHAQEKIEKVVSKDGFAAELTRFHDEMVGWYSNYFCAPANHEAAMQRFTKSASDLVNAAFEKISVLFASYSEAHAEEHAALSEAQVEDAGSFVKKYRLAYLKAKRAESRDVIQQVIIDEFEKKEGLLHRARGISESRFNFPISLEEAGTDKVRVVLPILSGNNCNHLVSAVAGCVGNDRTSTYVSSIVTADALPEICEDIREKGVTPRILSISASGEECFPSVGYSVTMREIASHFGISLHVVWNVIYNKYPELQKQSELRKVKGVPTRLFSPQILEQPRYFSHCKKTTSTKPDSTTGRVSKEELLEQGKEYLVSESETPTARQWKKAYGQPSIDAIIHHWGNFSTFIEDLCGTPEKEGRGKLSMLKDADRGMSDSEIANKYGVTKVTVRRHRTMAGIWQIRYVAKHYKTLDDIADKEMPGVISYPKDDIRAKIILQAIDNLPKEEINYLGLEGAHFGSYLAIADIYCVNPKQSLVAENNLREFRIMRSIVRAAKKIMPGKEHTKGGEVFRGLNLYNGYLCDAVAHFAKRKQKSKWNLINLDYNGGITNEKIRTVELLFSKKLIAKEAVMFVTLNNCPRVQERVANGNGTKDRRFTEGYGTTDQVGLMNAYVKRYAEQNGYDAQPIGEADEYRSRKAEMLFMGYKLRRKE